MRYTYEYKRKCVELYREGKWPETPEGVSDKSFRDKVRLWVRAEDSRGPEALKHKNFNRNWTPEERLELVSQVMSGKSCVSVAIEAGIQDRLLYQWVQNYKTKGYNGLIFHSDQGWQYQHVYFRQALKDHKIIQSMSRKGNCYDNCIMETFFGRMKNEMFYGHEKEYSSFETFAKAVDGYINYYNNERIQEKTKWMPPTKFREASMCT